MPQNSVDLAGIFQTVTQALAQNQQALNQADEYNQDHGDNMVQTFQTITNALEQKKGSSDSSALAYAAKQLSKNTTSGSGQLYAQNLAQAAGQFKGQKIDTQGALQLLQMLIGSGQGSQPGAQPAGGDVLGGLLGGMTGGGMQAPAQPSSQGGGDMLGTLLGGLTGAGMETPAQQAPQSGGDLLGSLLGGLAGAGAETPAQQTPQAGGDMLGALLGGLTGGSSAPTAPVGGAAAGQNGLGLDDLLNAGMAFMQARQTGGSNAQALLQAFLAGSGMGNTTHREQSTALVVNTFLQALSAFNSRQ